MTPQDLHVRSSAAAVGVALVPLFLLISLLGSAYATHVTPVEISNDDDPNPTCAEYAPAGESWTELKVDPPTEGESSDGTLTVNIVFTELKDSEEPVRFDWSSNIGVDAVIVKDGNFGHNIYFYDPEETEDDGLESLDGISHISFCYDEDDNEVPPEQVPEFGSVGIATALGSAGLLFARRLRRQRA